MITRRRRSRRRKSWSSEATPLFDRAPLQCGAGGGRPDRPDRRAVVCCGRHPRAPTSIITGFGSAACRSSTRASRAGTRRSATGSCWSPRRARRCPPRAKSKACRKAACRPRPRARRLAQIARTMPAIGVPDGTPRPGPDRRPGARRRRSRHAGHGQRDRDRASSRVRQLERGPAVAARGARPARRARADLAAQRGHAADHRRSARDRDRDRRSRPEPPQHGCRQHAQSAADPRLSALCRRARAAGRSGAGGRPRADAARPDGAGRHRLAGARRVAGLALPERPPVALSDPAAQLPRLRRRQQSHGLAADRRPVQDGRAHDRAEGARAAVRRIRARPPSRSPRPRLSVWACRIPSATCSSTTRPT